MPMPTFAWSKARLGASALSLGFRFNFQSEVLEFNVGVSHIALDEERERNTRIRERIESIIAALEKNVNLFLLF